MAERKTGLLSRLSLRWRLLLLISGAALLILMLAVQATSRQAKHEIQELMDGQMRMVAQLALHSARVALSSQPSSQPFGAHNIEAGPGKVLLELRLSNLDGRVHGQSAGVPEAAMSDSAGFNNLNVQGTSWRRMTQIAPVEGLRVEVFASIARRDKEAHEIASKTVQPLFIALPLLLLFVFAAVRHGLRPLEGMAHEVATRNFDHLAPLALPTVPHEARPLAEAIDRLLARLATARDNERRFTADAAHELRTPLAAIRVQAQVARMSTDQEQRERALVNVMSGLERSTRLVEQLLGLARLDPLARLPQPETINLGELLKTMVLELQDVHPLAELTAEVSGSDTALKGDTELLRVAVRNLVDNAVRYGGGKIVVFVRRTDEALWLGVADGGSGVAAHELERLRERFYRSVSVQTLSGSGLGLAIVERIAELHGATLTLANRPAGGFEAALRWAQGQR